MFVGCDWKQKRIASPGWRYYRDRKARIYSAGRIRMAMDVARTLREALSKLSAERQRIDKQIAAVGVALRSVDGRPTYGQRVARRASTGVRSAKTVPSRRLSATTRKAISATMKAYWAKRKKEAKVSRRRAEK
jgi:hypothetical protein